MEPALQRGRGIKLKDSHDGKVKARGIWPDSSAGRYPAQPARALPHPAGGDFGRLRHIVERQHAAVGPDAVWWDISAGVENVFDRKAPFIQNNPNANTDTMTYDLLGRRRPHQPHGPIDPNRRGFRVGSCVTEL